MSVRRLIPLSQLSAGRRNPRRVQPERDAHRRLVASIKAVGLIQPLVVRLVNGDPESGYRVVAGKRRLEALRDVYRGSEADPQIKCEVEDVDDATADSMALAENFAREGMHPLDEAEAFARLADAESKGVTEVAAEFGVTPHYVKQRMKLAGLADAIKAAYREGQIDTGTAEVFSSVPAVKQLEVWNEVDGKVHHAHHARNLIQNDWIDAKLARFDVDLLPGGAVSSDLFNDCVLIERKAFMEAQAEAVAAESEALTEDGWGEVVVAPHGDVYDRLTGMDHPAPDYDEPTKAKLIEMGEQREALEVELEKTGEDEDEALDALYAKFDALEEEQHALIENAEPVYAEAVKATATVFLMVGPDGSVSQEVRVPRRRGSQAQSANGSKIGPEEPPKPPTSEDLADRQQEAAYVHETIAVRSALLADNDHAAKTRRVLLVMMLCEKVGSHDGLLIHHDYDPIARYAEMKPKDKGPFVSEAWDALGARGAELDPFGKRGHVQTDKAYQTLMGLADDQLDALIDLLIVQRVAGSLNHHTELIARLVVDLGVELRAFWTPDAEWFSGYKKIQLAHLIGKLRGKAHGGAAERLKKSELVESLATLFADACDGKLDNTKLAEKVNAWIPSCVRPRPRKAKKAKATVKPEQQDNATKRAA